MPRHNSSSSPAGWEAEFVTWAAPFLAVLPRATQRQWACCYAEGLLGDLPWMMRFMNAAPRARLVLLAGTATNRNYLDEYLAKRLDANDGVLEGALARPTGHGKVVHHVLRSNQRRLPVCFCSSSPSDRRQPGLLLKRVRRDAAELRHHLASGDSTS